MAEASSAADLPVRKARGLPSLRFVLALSALLGCGAGEERAAGGAPAGAAPGAASIELVGFADLEPALAAARGQGMLLNFWAIWCQPCVAELPELLEVAHAYRERGGRVVGVSFDLMVPGADSAGIESRMRDFLAARGLDYPVLIYDDDDFAELEERYGVGGEIPVTLAIDASGAIVDRQIGKADRQRFEQLMLAALGEKR
jgi:thiol-disulfide isomerase/thioredoxin